MSGRTLLALVEFLPHHALRQLYADLGYRVICEYSVRKAMAAVRKEQPAVVVADFYYQPDFRDRVSNLESLLATVQRQEDIRVLVFHETAHIEALNKLRQRFRIDAALSMPVDTTQLQETLRAWL